MNNLSPWLRATQTVIRPWFTQAVERDACLYEFQKMQAFALEDIRNGEALRDILAEKYPEDAAGIDLKITQARELLDMIDAHIAKLEGKIS